MSKWKWDQIEFLLKVIINYRNIRINLPRQLWEDDLNGADYITIEKHKNGKITIRES